ncbi:Ig-like domain-containing protein [Pedobacter sp. B4-66]|uniref:immunoglobulin domain-containing protein n=1 Tax=Pedobacter sp. B4-66 TaxID=2817280 RepID=UPI001BDB602B|nr:Ig-like domain-containing protein [Pedobacter sp. B4-66]
MLLVFGGDVKGQSCTPQVRKYATTTQVNEGLLTSVENPNFAVDNIKENYSNLNALLAVGNLITVTQYLKFSTPVAAGTPVTVKATFPTSILSLVGGIELQPFKNLRDIGFLGPNWIADPVGQVTSNSTLLSLINGAGDMEITIVPQTGGTTSTPLIYDGVWIRLSGVAIGANLNLFHAYIKEDAAAGNQCNTSIDVLAGVRAGTAVGGIASALGAVTNKWNAIDGNLSTYAEMDVTAQVLSETFHTTIFKTVAQPGDAVQIVLQKPGGGLLDLNVLNGFTVQMYNGNTPSGTPFSSSSGLLSLSLLPGSTTGNEKYTLTIPVPSSYGSFDRVEIKIGGVATVSLTSKLRIYEVNHIIFPLTLIDGVASTSKSICQNNTATLSIKDPQDCTTYNWYKVASGGTKITTSTNYTPQVSDLVLGDNIFYVEAIRTNCSETSGRVPLTIKVNPLPDAGTITGNTGVCVTQTTILSNLISGGTWTSSDITKATISASGVVTGVAIGPVVITYTVTDPITGCTSFTTKNITVNALPNPGTITGNTSLCVNQTILLSNTVSGGIWASSDITKASINSSGLITGIVAGTTTVTYTVTNAGCSSAAAVVITVNPLPTATISGSVIACQGTAPKLITFTGGNGTTPYTFTYKIDSGPNKTISTTLGSNTATITIPTSTLGTFKYTLLSVMDSSSTQCSNAQTGTATITINAPLPKPIVSIN